MKGRWDDWGVVVAGVAAAVSWIWHGMLGIGAASMVLLGVLMVLTAVMSITRPGLITTEAVTLVLGVLMFLTPWLFGFADTAPAAWTGWVVGAVVVVMGLIGLPLSNAVHRRAVPH
ncbi:hypothetical protein HDA32_000857 [Spinactinospora alkalitolerans]|uniref:SPW repeat-containing integral membrane domain-containing protein n=1 Tax=Spinactinospora alkalitolerans TaxID=687207 RepID=A0A852TR12_9ACTN|nr:SPW repeat protein [Spinactinospora alkalitolerans]NYE45737.1 hypothetical protein [Spinactinospora alkalitolerans]